MLLLTVSSSLAANTKSSSSPIEGAKKSAQQKQVAEKRSDEGVQTVPQKRGAYGLDPVEIANAPPLPSFATYSSTPAPFEYSSGYPEVIIKPSPGPIPIGIPHSHPPPPPVPVPPPPHGVQLNPHVKEITVTKEVPVPYYVHVEKKVPYPVYIQVPHPYPVTVEKHVPYEVRVPVDRPVPVPVPKPYPVHVTVEKPVPVPVEKHVPYPVRVPVDRPYPVHVPVEKPVPYPVKVAVPVDRPVPLYPAFEKNYHYHHQPEETPYVKAPHSSYYSHYPQYHSVAPVNRYSGWPTLYKRNAH